MKNLSFLIVILLLFFTGCNKKDATTNQTSQTTTQQQSNTGVSSSDKSTAQGLTIPYVLKFDKAPNQKAAANFSWEQNGKTVSLSDFKGRVILLNIWAQWCGPCKQEMPYLSQIYDEYKDKGLVIIGVSIDKANDRAKLESYLQSNPVSYLIVHDVKGDILKTYPAPDGSDMINVFPTTFIIDKKGEIVESFVGSKTKEAFISYIKKYL
ncbi:MAG: TlpA disulfide reductase family protein [Ignavibacteria bacterium]